MGKWATRPFSVLSYAFALPSIRAVIFLAISVRYRVPLHTTASHADIALVVPSMIMIRQYHAAPIFRYTLPSARYRPIYLYLRCRPSHCISAVEISTRWQSRYPTCCILVSFLAVTWQNSEFKRAPVWAEKTEIIEHCGFRIMRHRKKNI